MSSFSHRRHVAAVLSAAVLTVSMGACAPTPTAESVSSKSGVKAAAAERKTVNDVIEAGDISKYCGGSPVKIGVSLPQGPVNWSVEALALVKKEAAKCPNIEVLSTFADGDPQKAVSNINSLLSRGVKAIIAEPVSGEAELPVYRKAVKAGVPVVTFVAESGGTNGVDVTDHVGPDFDLVVAKWFEWLDAHVGSGKLVYLGGVPGAPITRLWFNAVKKQLETRPQYELVEPNPIDTDWDSGKRKTAMAALLAKHGRIDIVMDEANQSDRGTLDAYLEAGLKLPAIAGVAESNAMGCFWQENQWDWTSTGGTQALAVVALRKALAAANGIEDPEASRIVLPLTVETPGGSNPQCDQSMPGDSDPSVPLTKDERKAAFS
ncbi:substrate-binding domain-containing protein [Arthrobacter sp. KNU40]|uniref:substrate-binding domain-containing protein n=1 Tax=Arthrobacter sp. KNU40 TaxID=3447965 RepID=UPI003F5E2851